jgi:superfamily II DNA or RNA helicase
MAGIEKSDDSDVIISTWQSIYEEPEEYFKQFELIIGDEAHLFKAKSLTTIMDKMKNTKLRIGMSGTLDGTEVNKLVLEGLFGPIHQVVTTRQLIDRGDVSDIKIRVLVLNHLQENKNSTRSYEEEISYLIASNARNNFITNLALSLKGNSLILFSRVDDHGKILRDLLKQKDPIRNIKYVSGEVTADERNLIRAYMEANDQVITVASYQTFSTGINIKRLNNIIFASPTKSKIRTFQSIGRGLRLDAKNNKTHVDLYDIGDDLVVGYKQNYTYKHMIERMKMYESEAFVYETHKINLKG